MQDDSDFIGAKLALFLGDTLVVIRRDAHPGLPWPGYWDFPGGGREAGESPAACALRETREELGLNVPETALHRGRAFRRPDGALGWMFAARLPASSAHDVRLGDEGQGWALMTPAAYLADPLGIPHFKERLRLYLMTTGE
ncbi:NUDIX hydrolase [Lutimaribacter sp. EGI FJ00015]|uniref:NUDIX hydrolase n=1 Tax=Lutimaribacter degradans TaxID=2945989 RepID=A0ACC5ZWM4_9RHOB|nr:NUDIX hydrolase [Lutimaribacter sp. EGI FJ00013]MCM2562732.1 NUDIX hydrolase [Lutimaribacter sp. EGI FJ00013]MCO0613889.1 NUDIX hydrolase [Lutimaribacter sp. EGI FJ00015]MCO0636861.1 NUDIX hydrolase [Lutimaribacter sp. EGI FJ00014]